MDLSSIAFIQDKPVYREARILERLTEPDRIEHEVHSHFLLTMNPFHFILKDGEINGKVRFGYIIGYMDQIQAGVLLVEFVETWT